MVVGDYVAPQLLGRLNDGGYKAHIDMPLDVAVEQEDAGVVGREAQHNVRVAVDRDNIATRRRAGIVVGPAWPPTRPATGSVNHLELVAVQVEWVYGEVQVVDDQLNHIPVRDDERIDEAVHDGVGVSVAHRHGRVQRRDFLRDEGISVEAGAENVMHG
jgi:hypothetical protein